MRSDRASSCGRRSCPIATWDRRTLARRQRLAAARPFPRSTPIFGRASHPFRMHVVASGELMTLDRRSFVATAASLAAAAVVLPSDAVTMPMPVPASDDPLGVRGDFPIVANKTFLNSAYIAPIPKQVVAAGLAFLEEKANNSFLLGPL